MKKLLLFATLIGGICTGMVYGMSDAEEVSVEYFDDIQGMRFDENYDSEADTVELEGSMDCESSEDIPEFKRLPEQHLVGRFIRLDSPRINSGQIKALSRDLEEKIDNKERTSVVIERELDELYRAVDEENEKEGIDQNDASSDEKVDVQEGLTILNDLDELYLEICDGSEEETVPNNQKVSLQKSLNNIPQEVKSEIDGPLASNTSKTRVLRRSKSVGSLRPEKLNQIFGEEFDQEVYPVNLAIKRGKRSFRKQKDNREPISVKNIFSSSSRASNGKRKSPRFKKRVGGGVEMVPSEIKKNMENKKVVSMLGPDESTQKVNKRMILPIKLTKVSPRGKVYSEGSIDSRTSGVSVIFKENEDGTFQGFGINESITVEKMDDDKSFGSPQPRARRNANMVKGWKRVTPGSSPNTSPRLNERKEK